MSRQTYLVLAGISPRSEEEGVSSPRRKSARTPTPQSVTGRKRTRVWTPSQTVGGVSTSLTPCPSTSVGWVVTLRVRSGSGGSGANPVYDGDWTTDGAD